jgi:RHS repeat-associated protein
MMVDESANVLEGYHYNPLGAISFSVDMSENTHLFMGKEIDEESGLSFFGARYYNPEIGRWISRDDLAGETFEPQTLNRYAYVNNNPLKYLDLSGLSRLLVYTANRRPGDTAEFQRGASMRYNLYVNNRYKDIRTPKIVYSGDQIVSTINAERTGSIQSLDIFSHSELGVNISTPTPDDRGTQRGLFANKFYAWLTRAFYDFQYNSQDIATYSDIDFSKFDQGATVEFHGCHMGENYFFGLIPGGAKKFSLAAKKAGRSDIVVVGHVGRSGPAPYDRSGQRVAYQDGKKLEKVPGQ